MNQKTTYEYTIAEKLAALQVPDMREAIWSRIEDQLDIDMPQDDPNGPDTPGTPNWMSITKRFGTFSVIVALITTILFINKKSHQPATHHKNTPSSIHSAPAPNYNAESPPSQAAQPLQQNTNGGSTNHSNTNITPLSVSDSVYDDVGLADAPILPDSFRQQKNLLPPLLTNTPSPLKQDTLPVIPKKSKGFKGITDDDYRINLKKDSVP